MMSSHANSKNKLTNEEKYRRMRDLNNIASKKCRENQKNKNKELEEEILNLERTQEKLIQKEKKLMEDKNKLRSMFMDSFVKKNGM